MSGGPTTSTTTRVGLLLCGHIAPGAVDLGGDYPELFDDLLGPHDIELVVFEADEGKLPASVDDCAGWITSPARASVTVDEPWLVDTRAFVAELVARERPFAGICFGHQLLAQAAGGVVERAAGGWGVGAHEYEVVATEPWMDPPVPTLTVIASHEDQVTALPADARLLATSAYCPNAMFAVGERAFGLQPHPELTADHSRRLLELRRALIGSPRVDEALATLDRPLDASLIAGWIARFLRG